MRRAVPILLVAVMFFTTACHRSRSIIVASKNFTEQLILGEIAAQQLERKLHVKVERKLNLGGTLLAHEALLQSQIDIYPEYTGTAASVILKLPPAADPARSYIDVKAAYLRRFNVAWMPPLGFNDTFAMVVRREDAAQLSEPNLSHAGVHAWHLGVGYEFLTRPDGLRQLDGIYQLHWARTPVSMDLGLLYQALRQRRITMAAANSTDAQLTDPAFTALDDDRHAFPSYSACYLVRKPLAESQPAVANALLMLSNHIDADTMRRMNRSVEVEHQAVERVARNFLATQP